MLSGSACAQSVTRRAPNMLRLSVLIILLSHRIRTAHVNTNAPSLADRLDKLYEKLEKITIAPVGRNLVRSPQEKLYEKLDRLNSLTPDRIDLSDEDEELLSAIQMWGMLSAEQLDGVVKELQGAREGDDEKSAVNDGEYGDSEWSDEELQDLVEGEYPMDWYPDDEHDGTSTSKPVIGVTPSAFTRQDPEYQESVLSAVDPIAATNERPRILDDSSLTVAERTKLRRAIFANVASVVRKGKCREPQARWLNVRQLAPAANIVYMPPCVQLHRCAPDAGCCYDEAEVCAPVAGQYIEVPFYLNRANGNMSMARMLFFNHTQCACVSRETLQSTVHARVEHQKRENHETRKAVTEHQRYDRQPTEEPALEKDEPTAPPQLRRCTCPTLFLARITESGYCTCVCDWSELNRRRDCLSLARGREHFGLRDRVCVVNGDCTTPTCEYGAYDRSTGICPLRKYRRIKYHHRGRMLTEKSVEV
ncbi:uncharacterized protein LOC113511509 [Galleria mellonella]|uniref:Uncharacterized protein LOC113511509 n=1 Tax=Galleria mellonella TaxID=7137 RepID=A0ABM3MUZ7_GALME|nr:uncharacterized protein LOC113511509 [Galleria mellonella]